MKTARASLAKDDPWLRSFRLAGHQFPGIWSSIFPPELQKLRFPLERQASCHQCPQISAAGYRPDYRCCTYHPRIPNFLLGLALETEQGPAAFDKILNGGMLLPEGMLPSPQQWLDFMDDEDQDLYGRSEKVLCPMLEPSSGRCQIHAFRNAVCSTYFCSHEQGEAGEEFWGQLQTLGSQVEMILAQWALEELGFDLKGYLRTLDRLAPEVRTISADLGWSQEVLKELWGPWKGREKELFSATAEQLAKHRSELWEIAKGRTIQEALLFERAVDGLLASENNEDPDESYEIEAAEISWKRCLDAYERLWSDS